MQPMHWRAEPNVSNGMNAPIHNGIDLPKWRR
jgi:hypothetical protein